MLELVGAGDGPHAGDDRHLPVAVGSTADDAAQRPPIGEVGGLMLHVEMHGAGAVRIEMVAVARRAARQPGGQRRRPAFEVAARAHHAVGVDDHAGVAERQVLAAHGRQDGLVVDAGVGHQHAQRLEGGDGASLDGGHRVGLLEALVGGEIEPARVGDGGDAHAPLSLGRRRQPFEPGDAGLAQALGVGHHVRLADGHEVGRIEELADGDLVTHGPLAHGPQLARQHGPLFLGQAHGDLISSAAAASLSTGVMRAISLSTSFCSPAGPRSAPCGAVLPSST